MTDDPRIVTTARGTRALLPETEGHDTLDIPALDAALTLDIAAHKRRRRIDGIRSVLLRAGAIAALVAATAGSIAILAPAPAHAFIFGPSIVFDPTNYGENVLSAARALEQINNQILSLQNEAQILINQARNLTALPTSLLSDIQANHTRMQMLLRQAERLAYDVQSIEQAFQQSYSGFAAGQTDAQLVDLARSRWQDSVQAFEHALQVGAGAVGNIEDRQSQTGRLVDASQSAVGALQAVQAGNQLIAVQSAQLADLTALLAAQGRADAIEQARHAAEYEQAQEQFSRFMSGTPYQPQPVRMFGY